MSVTLCVIAYFVIGWISALIFARFKKQNFWGDKESLIIFAFFGWPLFAVYYGIQLSVKPFRKD